MKREKRISKSFESGLEKLGFMNDNSLFFTNDTKSLREYEIVFHVETARFVHDNITAIFFRRQLNGSYKSQVYILDYTGKTFSEQIEIEIAEIQRKIWSSGEVPLACFFFNTEIKIVDCTKHLTKDLKPEYLIDKLRLTDESHKLYNEQFAVKIKSGIFWEQEEIRKKFHFKDSAYDTLIKNIRIVTEKLSKELKKASKELINKIIVQSILIKFLEETSDDEGKKLLTEKYFKKYSQSNSFGDVLKRGNFVNLLNDLNVNFNGNVFQWEQSEQEQLESLDLSIVAELLDTDRASIESIQLEIGFPDWRYFEFKYIPVELISRLYEEFLSKNRKDSGLFYTPSHLAKLLVDECLPLKKYQEINLTDFTILDPACGSGIFLVTVFKRLVQIWRLQNNFDKPKIGDLKKIIRNIYGVDKEEQAVMLSSFSLSLALCNELKPIDIITKLKFDELAKENLIHSDFFVQDRIQFRKFDLIIGNPPFRVGGLNSYSKHWIFESRKVKIPQGQIALKFLSESFPFLKENGLVCLIIKASGLLYNSSSKAFKEALFLNYNVVQLFDFTALARNRSLWDNGADVATAAVFVRNNKPDSSKNILHITFRRTKATKERIIFEIDDYDLHYVNRETAINNEFVWKNNLLGGGRIKDTVEKLSNSISFTQYLKENLCIVGEGFKIGSNGHLKPGFIYSLKTLPTEAISENRIAIESLREIQKSQKFEKVPNELIFRSPNIIIKENIGKSRIPLHLNYVDFSYQHKIVGISGNIETLNEIKNRFERYNDLFRFLIYSRSGQVLVNLNTAILKKDLMNLPFGNISLSVYDLNIINEVNSYMQDSLRHGEKSKALQKIELKKIESVLSNYGTEFSRALNSVYESHGKRFRLSDIIHLEGVSLIAAIFRYDNNDIMPLIHNDFTKLSMDGLTNNEISAHLSVKRIIKLYPQKDTIVFIKPNQYRYWLSLIAYRDADKCFSDFTNQIPG